MNPLEAFIKGLGAMGKDKPKEEPPPKPQQPPQQPLPPTPKSDAERGIEALRDNKKRLENPNFAQGGPIPGTPPADPTVDNKQINARSGEFVMPEPVVRYYGEKFFMDLIESVPGQSAPEQALEKEEPNPFTMMAMDEGD